MKNIKIKTILACLSALLVVPSFTACDDDDDMGGEPVILQVRTTDPALKDSTFVKANPGQLILIEGHNLSGLKHVYFNSQEAWFNPNYATSTHIIVTIPADLELTGTNPNLPKELRLVFKSGREAVYGFHVLSPAPVINRLAVEYPVNAGDEVLIYGENFYEVEALSLEGTDEEGTPNGVNVEVSQFSVVGNGYNLIQYTMPAGAAPKGNVVLTCAAAQIRLPYATEVPPAEITSFSSDMPIIGDEFFITGNYFIKVSNVNINGEIDIPGSDLRVSESNDTIYLKLPTAPTKSGYVTITSSGGKATDDKLFYPLEYVIADLDNVGSMSWTGSAFEGDGANPPYITTGKAAGIHEENCGGWNWWFGNILINCQYHSAIPDDTPVSELVYRFELYLSYDYPFSDGLGFNVIFADKAWDAMSGYIPKSMVTKKTEVGKWMTCEIPVSMLTNCTNYGGIRTSGTEIGLAPKNTGGTSIPVFEVFCDNFRILKK